MRPKFLKQSRKTIIKRTNHSKESKKDSGIRSESEESEHENEEFQQTENESEEFLNDVFDDDVYYSFNRESKTSLDHDRPERKIGKCQNGPEEKDIFIRNKSGRETASSNRPHDNPLSADDRIFLADDEGSLVTSAISDTKVNKRRRQRNKRHIKESTGFDTLDEDIERNLHVDMTESRNSFKNIKDTTKTLRHKTKQSAHGNLYNKLHSNSPENRTYKSSKLEVPRSQTESFPYVPNIGEVEAYANESSRGNFEDAPKAGYADRSPSQPPSIGLSIKRSTEFNTQTAIEIYKMLVRSRRERFSFTQLTDILLANKRFQGFCENESDLVSLLEQNEDKFFITYSATDEPLFSVKTNIAICAIFTNNPCDQIHTCQDLHICKYFLLGKCPLTKCKFGHKLSTKHNRTVFRHFTLDEVDVESKMHLIRHIDSRSISTLPLVCKFYNNKGGCKKNNKCTHLHLCKYFINDDCKFGRQCTRCHNILTNQPLTVLKRYGLNPTSFNIGKLLNALKDTLDDGDDLLERNHQHRKDVNADQNDSFSNTNDRHGYKASDTTSSVGSDTDGESGDETEREWTEQSLDDGTSTAAQGVSSEHDINEYKQTIENDVSLLHKPTRGNGCHEQISTEIYQEQHITHKHDFLTNRDHQDDIKLVMTFDAKPERKHFMIREVNGQLEITNESGNWHVMSAKYASRLYQLQDEFITFSEKVISQKQNKK